MLPRPLPDTRAAVARIAEAQQPLAPAGAGVAAHHTSAAVVEEVAAVDTPAQVVEVAAEAVTPAAAAHHPAPGCRAAPRGRRPG